MTARELLLVCLTAALVLGGVALAAYADRADAPAEPPRNAAPVL